MENVSRNDMRSNIFESQLAYSVTRQVQFQKRRPETDRGTESVSPGRDYRTTQEALIEEYEAMAD